TEGRPKSRSAVRATTRARLRYSSGTTVPDSTCSTSTSCSACFSACTWRKSSKARASASRPFSVSSIGMAARSVPRERSTKARRSISRCRKVYKAANARGAVMAEEKLGRILMVEDDPNDVELTITALEEYHLANEVVVARDGQQALDYLYCRG